jgi:membrane protein implicated in regulation of membrane protease activity
VGAAAAAALSMSVPGQIVVFCVVLTVSLLALRPRLVAGLNSRGVPSRTEPLIGKDGIVTSDIDPTAGGGRVNVGGEDWAARSTERIPAGTKVRVAGADGIVLEVRRS